MARKRFTTGQIIGLLREAEVRLGQGQAIGTICRGIGISEQSYYRWPRYYGGLKLDQAKRLKDLKIRCWARWLDGVETLGAKRVVNACCARWKHSFRKRMLASMPRGADCRIALSGSHVMAAVDIETGPCHEASFVGC